MTEGTDDSGYDRPLGRSTQHLHLPMSRARVVLRRVGRGGDVIPLMHSHLIDGSVFIAFKSKSKRMDTKT